MNADLTRTGSGSAKHARSWWTTTKESTPKKSCTSGAHAEQRATDGLEGRPTAPKAAPAFARLERLIPALLTEMRQDLADNPRVRECILMGQGVYNGDGNLLFMYYYAEHPDLDSQFQILENYGLVRNVTRTNVTRYRISEDLAQYLGVA